MMDIPERKEYLMGIRSLLYVAITRARQMVFISGGGEATGLLEEMECMKECKKETWRPDGFEIRRKKRFDLLKPGDL